MKTEVLPLAPNKKWGHAEIAQVGEQWFETPCVGCASQSLGTIGVYLSWLKGSVDNRVIVGSNPTTPIFKTEIWLE